MYLPQKNKYKMNTKNKGLILFLLMISPIFIIGLVIYLLIANTPPEEKARNKAAFEQQKVLAQQMWQQQKEQEERNRLAIEGSIIQPNEKLPVYDNKKYGLMKIDYRYFLVPREYAQDKSFSFLWPSKTPLMSSYQFTKNEKKILSNPNGDVGNTIVITAFFYVKESQNTSIPIGYKACNYNNYTAFIWNSLVIGVRYDKKLHSKDWPSICQETLRILNLVKEVKP